MVNEFHTKLLLSAQLRTGSAMDNEFGIRQYIHHGHSQNFYGSFCSLLQAPALW